MIPFLEPKKMSDTIVAKRKEDGTTMDEGPSDSHMIAEELINAVHAKDVGAVAEALEAFMHIGSGPMEGEV